MFRVRGARCAFFFPVRWWKGDTVSEVNLVNGGHGTAPPAAAGRRPLPLRALGQNALRSTRWGGTKGFVPGSLASSVPGIPGNRVRLLEAACQGRTAQRHLCSCADVQHRDGRACEVPRDFRTAYYRYQQQQQQLPTRMSHV